MPSNIGKTTKRATTKRAVDRRRSMSHRELTLEWLRKDATNAAALLEAALETRDAGDFMAALRTVTEARGGISKIAEETGLNREALYRTLSKNGNPQLSSLLPILQAAGLKLTVQAA